jgi:hypothetical protein
LLDFLLLLLLDEDLEEVEVEVEVEVEEDREDDDEEEEEEEEVGVLFSKLGNVEADLSTTFFSSSSSSSSQAGRIPPRRSFVVSRALGTLNRLSSDFAFTASFAFCSSVRLRT